jgi:spore coat polysaccharide biosynthesis protein SpsF
MAGPGIVLLARHASRRFPGKALAVLAGRTLLEHCIGRLMAASVGPVVLATTTRADDDVLAVMAARLGARVFRGDEHDVLGRTVAAAAAYSFDRVLRATGDNPFVDVDGPHRALALLAPGVDYACEADLPVGAAVEAVTFAALSRAADEATDPVDREHVTTYIKRHGDRFRCVHTRAPRPLCAPDLRLTVDTPSDLAWLRSLAASTGSDHPALGALIAAAAAVPLEA